MISISHLCKILFIIAYCFIKNAHGQTQNEIDVKNSTYIETPSIPAHNDTSHDMDGADHDSAPFRDNGSGTHEAHSQNYAAETNGTHGMKIEDFQQIILDEHNKYRREMCADDLINDETLHQIAQKRAHDRANGKELESLTEYNENACSVVTDDPSKVTGDMIVKVWHDEGQHFDINNETSAMSFSQIEWKGTKSLGVGHAYSGSKLYVVTLYNPPGNIHGQYAANIGCNSTNGQNRVNK